MPPSVAASKSNKLSKELSKWFKSLWESWEEAGAIFDGPLAKKEARSYNNGRGDPAPSLAARDCVEMSEDFKM
jgi:hypothetical protein